MQEIIVSSGGRRISLSREKDGQTTTIVVWEPKSNFEHFRISFKDLPGLLKPLSSLRVYFQEPIQVLGEAPGMISIELLESPPSFSLDSVSLSSSPKEGV
jgi:hypothetical protein